MATITIDGKSYVVRDGVNLLHAALSLGIDLPYFCWHPALGSVGACRQCAVKAYRDEKDTRGKLVMACMTGVSNGLRVSVEDGDAKDFRRSIAEWLMTNHPHDCPVCDEGGECHLQDMTLMTGQNYRRFRFRKRTFENQNLGPFVNHEMNRCIACYRCVRFYNDYAGGNDFGVFAIHNLVYFGRHEDGVLENEFSGNLVEVCPTGVFTDKTLKQHFTRKWDLQNAPSICVQCGLGCNTIAGERYGMLRRIRNRYHQDVNGYFLCDRGRYGYEFVNSSRRIRHPYIRITGGEGVETVDRGTALGHFVNILRNAHGIVGIGSPRASLESNFALRRLVGAKHFSDGTGGRDSATAAKALAILRGSPVRSASLRDIESADALVILGEDVTNTAPRIALSARQAVRREPIAAAGSVGIPDWHDAAIREFGQDQRGPLFIASVSATKLDDAATATFRNTPDEIARLGFAIAHEIDSHAPGIDGLEDETLRFAREVAAALKSAARPVVISGTSLGTESILDAAENIALALHDGKRIVGVAFALPECNSLGVRFLEGMSLDAVFDEAANGSIDTAIIVENDLYRRASGERVGRFFGSLKHIVVIDHLENRTTAAARAVFPAATFADGTGTFVSSEGRAQRSMRVFAPHDEIRESWRWLRDAMAGWGRGDAAGWTTVDDVLAALATEVPALVGALDAAPQSNVRVEGTRIPRETHRSSGRTAIHADVSVHEPKPPEDPDTPLAHSMEGYPGKPPAALIPFFWSPGWNSVQSVNKYQTGIAGPLRDGEAGKRIIEPSGGRKEYAKSVPAAHEERDGTMIAVPLYHIFGSEELSVESPGIAGRAPSVYAALHPDDAARLGAVEGSRLDIALGGRTIIAPLVTRRAQAKGTVGLPAGIPLTLGLDLPAPCACSKAKPV